MVKVLHFFIFEIELFNWEISNFDLFWLHKDPIVVSTREIAFSLDPTTHSTHCECKARMKMGDSRSVIFAKWLVIFDPHPYTFIEFGLANKTHSSSLA